MPTVTIWKNSRGGPSSYPDSDGRPIKMQRKHRRWKYSKDEARSDWPEYKWVIRHTGTTYECTGNNCTDEANELAWRIQNQEWD